MPGRLRDEAVQRKRKRDAEKQQSSGEAGSRKAPKTADKDAQSNILQHESALLESQERYDSFDSLFDLVQTYDTKPKTATLAAVSLCRVFCRLIASERFIASDRSSASDREDVRLLKNKLRDYVAHVNPWIGSPHATLETTAVTLLMRIIKEEVSQDRKRAEQVWKGPSSTFAVLIKLLLERSTAEGARHSFVEDYVEEHDDVRYYTLLAVKQFMSSPGKATDDAVSNVIDLVLQIEGIPQSQDELTDWFGLAPQSEKHSLLLLSAHRRAAQDAWLSIFRTTLTIEQRKRLLEVMSEQILPWFSTKLEYLTDFLTDSFGASGSTATLALSGLFYLITNRNIDYPDFYTKLYSLLDDEVLHSKHRNRFLRLLDSCLASSHLPAALVASFIKRLARLALQAPSGAIVWLFPWTYNLLRQHPSCTFMLHRSPHPAHHIYAAHENFEEEGMADPFDMLETDPMRTRAIDSSLWELDTLRSHYHPNVATLAGILAEQFTKREYQLEDFLDHTYASLIDQELSKDLKKAPVVEFEIPKRIVTAEEGDGALNPLGQALQQAISTV